MTDALSNVGYPLGSGHPSMPSKRQPSERAAGATVAEQKVIEAHRRYRRSIVEACEVLADEIDQIATELEANRSMVDG